MSVVVLELDPELAGHVAIALHQHRALLWVSRLVAWGTNPTSTSGSPFAEEAGAVANALLLSVLAADESAQRLQDVIPLSRAQGPSVDLEASRGEARVLNNPHDGDHVVVVDLTNTFEGRVGDRREVRPGQAIGPLDLHQREVALLKHEKSVIVIGDLYANDLVRVLELGRQHLKETHRLPPFRHGVGEETLEQRVESCRFHVRNVSLTSPPCP
jgi:hypothetical protein